MEANEFFLKNIKKKVEGEVVGERSSLTLRNGTFQREKGATLKGEVIVGKGTVVKSGAYIEGPVILGEDCNIGPNCFCLILVCLAFFKLQWTPSKSKYCL